MDLDLTTKTCTFELADGSQKAGGRGAAEGILAGRPGFRTDLCGKIHFHIVWEDRGSGPISGFQDQIVWEDRGSGPISGSQDQILWEDRGSRPISGGKIGVQDQFLAGRSGFRTNFLGRSGFRTISLIPSLGRKSRGFAILPWKFVRSPSKVSMSQQESGVKTMVFHATYSSALWPCLW